MELIQQNNKAEISDRYIVIGDELDLQRSRDNVIRGLGGASSVLSNYYVIIVCA